MDGSGMAESSMDPRRVRDPWFCLPVLFCMLMDAAVSLACQPSAYWQDPSCIHEGNATWALLLAKGPAARASSPCLSVFL